MKKRILSLFLVLVLCLSLLPASAFAAEPNVTESGAGAANEEKENEIVVPAEQNGSGSAEAKIGDTEYDTLADALSEMSEDEITLLTDVTATEELSVDVSTTINMDGHSITGNIAVNDSLTLKNGTVTGKVTVTVDATEGTFTMTAPADAAAAIDGGLEVNSGSCSVSGAKIGVKGTLYFDGTSMSISGSDKAVDLTAAAGPTNLTLYGSATETGDTSTEAAFADGTYKVGGEIAKKLSSTKTGSTEEPKPEVTLTLDRTSVDAKAGETVTFTVTYTGTDELKAYIQVNALNTYFDVTPTDNGTYTISVKINAETPTGDYKLFVHEKNNAAVQAKATIHVTALPDVAEVDGIKYKLLTRALAAAQNGDTVKMLADHVTDLDAADAGDESTLAVVTKELTLDLNGRTVDYLWVGEMEVNEEEEIITANHPGNLTVVNTSGGTVGIINDLEFVSGTLELQSGQLGYNGSSSVGLTCHGNSGSVTISGGTVIGLTVGDGASVTVTGGEQHAGNWFNDGTLNITGGKFSSVHFNNNGGTIAISGGTFGAIWNEGASTNLSPMLLLAKGCAFYDQYEPYGVKDASRADYLTNVTVKEHEHSFDNGKCACGVETKVKDSNGEYYNTLQSALDAAAKDSTIAWLQLEQDLTEEDVTFNGGSSTVTLKMNGKKLEVLAGPALTVNSGTLIIEGSATINQTGNSGYEPDGSPASAILLNNGKLVFEGELHAEGGRMWPAEGGRKPAVLAEGGELEFKDKVFLLGGLTMKNDSTLTGGLPVGSEFTAGNNETLAKRLDLTGHSSYKSLHSLLADKTALEIIGYNTLFKNLSAYTTTSSDVRVVTHEHSYHAEPGETNDWWYCDCGLSCDHKTLVNGICTVCGYACPHETVDENGICTACKAKMVARVELGETITYTSDLAHALNNAATGATITLLMDVDNSDQTAVVSGKTVTLNLDGHTITGGWIQVGINENFDTYISGTLKIIGSGSFVQTTNQGDLTAWPGGKLDLSGWTGGTISRMNLCDTKNADDALRKQISLTVGEKAGTIGELWLGNWQLDQADTANAINLSGGSYTTIRVGGWNANLISLGDLLGSGYVFKSGDEYMPRDTKFTEEQGGQGEIYNVKVVTCDHNGTNGFDFNEAKTCPYCGAPAVAQTRLKDDVTGNPWRNFANLQTALDADRDGSYKVRLLADVTGDYTIDGKTATVIDLQDYHIHGTVTVNKAESRGVSVSFSSNLNEVCIDKVVVHADANIYSSAQYTKEGSFKAIIGTLELADGATWENILYVPEQYGYRAPMDGSGSSRWYSKDTEYPEGNTLTNVIIKWLPLTSRNLSITKFSDDSTVYSTVERGTTTLLRAYCNTSAADVDVKFHIGEVGSTGEIQYAQVPATECRKIGTYYYYVLEYTFNKMVDYEIYFTASKDGYTVESNHKTLTVTKASIPADEITAPTAKTLTYNGSAQELVTPGKLDAQYARSSTACPAVVAVSAPRSPRPPTQAPTRSITRLSVPKDTRTQMFLIKHA